MKYAIVLGDGMADFPCAELGERTPLECAEKPYMDMLAQKGEIGLVRTVGEGLKPGSDVANLSVMGYDPFKYYTGRSSLEAASLGIELLDGDMTFRCNLVCLSDEADYIEKTMVDYSSDEISTAESRELIEALDAAFSEKFEFYKNSLKLYPGISYRHCLVWHDPETDFSFTPPHDITTKKIRQYLPEGDTGSLFLLLMKESYKILKDHPVNVKRIQNGLKPANSIWIWGEGKKPLLDSFEDKFGKKASVISAVDLIKGIAVCAGMKVVDVEGATGNINTDFKGKGESALNELCSGQDFVYVHVEAPDESGHRYEVDNKVKSIELIDKHIVKTLVEGLEKSNEDYAILILPDHPTPLSLRTHTSDPVPYVLYASSAELGPHACKYTEKCASESGNFFETGHLLINKLFNIS